MARAASLRFGNDAAWARAAGLPKETLSRLKRAASCDLRTLGALAQAVGYSLAAMPAQGTASGDAAGSHMPARFDREFEQMLLDLVAAGDLDPAAWRAAGPAYFMGGLAVLLASVRGADRERLLGLAETLHPGISTPEVFAAWLKASPLQPSRFLPMLEQTRA
jgi:hypothetical protein